MILPTLNDLDQKTSKKKIPNVEAAPHQTKGRKKSASSVDSLLERDMGLIEPEIKKIHSIFDSTEDPNKKMQLFNTIMKEVINKVPAQSALEGIKKLLKDKIETRELVSLLNHPSFSGGTGDNTQPNNTEAQSEDDLLTKLATVMLTMGSDITGTLQQNNGGGIPNSNNNNLMQILPLLMSSGKSGGSNSLLTLLPILRLLSQQQQPQVSNQPYNNGNNNNVMTEMWKDVMNIITQQNNTSQKPALDPILLAIISQLNNNNNNSYVPPPQKDNTETTLQMMNMMNQQQIENTRMLAEVVGTKLNEVVGMMPNPQDPTSQFINTFNMVKDIMGDKRERSEGELDYDLKIKEMELKKDERTDLIRREEASEERETRKTERIMDTASGILDKVLGEGTRALVGEFMSGRKQKNKNLPVGDLGGDNDDDDIDFNAL